ncbi:MAG: SOS response-associated peptidase [Polyangiaceae bacterium]
MCGRFTLTVHQLGDVVDLLGASIDPELLAGYHPRYNVAPGETHWLLRQKEGRREVIPAGWGLINHWAKDPRVGFKQINARAETLTTRPAFRDAFRQRRGVVLADGFYEWRGPKGAREPLRFHRPDDGLMLLAGLYEGWRDPETGDFRRTFTIVTTKPNRLVAPIHDRMPVVIEMEDLDAWLTGEAPETLLHPAPDDALVMEPASPRLNQAGQDDPDVLDPEDPRARRQLGLFS